MNVDPILVSRRHAANLLDISLPTLARRLREGVLPTVKIGGVVRIPRAAILELAAQAQPRVEPAAE